PSSGDSGVGHRTNAAVLSDESVLGSLGSRSARTQSFLRWSGNTDSLRDLHAVDDARDGRVAPIADGMRSTIPLGISGAGRAMTTVIESKEQTMTIEARMDRLERELAAARRRVRQMVGVVAVTFAGLAATMMLGMSRQATQPAEQLRARSFVMVDDKGRARGALEMLSPGPALSLMDQNGVPRVRLLMSADDGPRLSLADAEDNPRVSIAAMAEGPVLTFSDANHTPRVGMAATADGAAVSVMDERGKIRARMVARSPATPENKLKALPDGAFMLLGPDGKVVWRSPR
ncbi:MAG: hypothetical protein ACK462_11600, partial [Planctomyces sp.]